MSLVDYTLKLIGLGDSMRKWQGVIEEVDERRRDKVARYAEAIADTLQRAGEAFERLERDASDQGASRAAVRELARLAGYVENIVQALDGRIDGRRLAGVRRRLEGLATESLILDSVRHADQTRIDRLAAAEGYFRALADGLRA